MKTLIITLLALICIIESRKHKSKQIALELPQPNIRPYTMSYNFPKQTVIRQPLVASQPIIAPQPIIQSVYPVTIPAVQPCNPPVVQTVVAPPIVTHQQISVRKGPTVHGLMTNVAPESVGIINPEIARPKAIKHHVVHHDNIITQNHIVGQDITTHHRHQVDAFGNVIGVTAHSTARDIITPVQSVHRTTQVHSSMVDLTTGQNVAFDHGPIKTHGIQV